MDLRDVHQSERWTKHFHRYDSIWFYRTGVVCLIVVRISPLGADGLVTIRSTRGDRLRYLLVTSGGLNPRGVGPLKIFKN